MEFTIADGAVALVVLLSGVLAYSRGFTRELFAIAGWIIAAVAAFYGTPYVEPLMREIPVVGDFLASSCVISVIAAFALVMAVCLLILSVFTPLFSTLVLDSAFGPVDKVLGFLFGIARGILLIAVAYLIFTNLSAENSVPEIENAASKQLMDESAAILEANLPASVPTWFGERIDALMAPCAGDAPAPAPETTTDAPATGEQPAEGTGTTGN